MSDIGATRSVVIAGAGMGGLTAALALAHAGWTVDACRKAHGAGRIWCGIAALAQCQPYLIELGLKSALLRHGLRAGTPHGLALGQ